MTEAEIIVGVVIPMYNAAATINETLDSVLAQSHRALDVVVVDDGSTDRSVSIVNERAAADPRISLITQGNQGVAAARNAGGRVAKGDYLAFVDADDLWTRRKIEVQLQTLLHSDERVGVVYCWSALIDAHSYVIDLKHRPLESGDVLRSLCRNNFIGNGSSLLVTRAVFDAVGGFDPSLRAEHAQGCEDLLFALEAAERVHFEVVARPMVGYRVTNENMSSNVMAMCQSARIVLGQFMIRHPEMLDELEGHLARVVMYLLGRALQARRLRDAIALRNMLTEMSVTVDQRTEREWAAMYIKSLTVPTIVKKTVRRYTAPLYLANDW